MGTWFGPLGGAEKRMEAASTLGGFFAMGAWFGPPGGVEKRLEAASTLGGFLAMGTWFGPPMARWSLALPMLLYGNGLRVNYWRMRKSGHFEGWKGCALRTGGLYRWLLTKDCSGFEDGST